MTRVIVVLVSFFLVSGSKDWITTPDYLPDLGPILDDETLEQESCEPEFTPRHETILSNVLLALPKRPPPRDVFERCTEAFKFENLPLIGVESFMDHMKRVRREMVASERRSSSSVQVLPSQLKAFEEFREGSIIFDHAIEELEKKFDERNIPRITRRKARRVWNALGLGLRSSHLTTQHIRIIEEIVIEQGLNFYDDEDKREKYKEACRLFSEADLGPVSFRVFLKECRMIKLDCPLPRYSKRHKEIAGNVLTQFKDQPLGKIHSIASHKFKSENLRPVPLSTFRSWSRRGLPRTQLSSPDVGLHNVTASKVNFSHNYTIIEADTYSAPKTSANCVES